MQYKALVPLKLENMGEESTVSLSVSFTLVPWSYCINLQIVYCFKYIVFMYRIDNCNESSINPASKEEIAFNPSQSNSGADHSLSLSLE